MKIPRLVLVAAALLIASSQWLHADPVRVDQVSALSPTNAGHGSIREDVAQAQTFTVGLTGQLVALEVYLSRWGNVGPLLLDVRPTDNHGRPIEDDNGALATFSIPPAGIPASVTPVPVRFDLASAQLQVMAGQMLAFVFRSPQSVRMGFSLPEYQLEATSTSYPGGASYQRSPTYVSPTFTPSSGAWSDYAFSTFVQPNPVPEPATIVLVGSGLVIGALGRARRRVREKR